MESIKISVAALPGDIFGGISAAFVTLPKSMAFGALIFAPLGPDFIPLGILAGLIAQICSNIIRAFIGSVDIMNNGPFSLTSLMLVSALEFILLRLQVHTGQPADSATAIVLLFIVVFLAGIVQILFGILKIGDLAKYIPYPVLSGLFNGAAILIFITQIPTMLGLTKAFNTYDAPTLLLSIQPLTLGVGLITSYTVWLAYRWRHKIPPAFVGILVGTASYYLLSYLGYHNALGPVIGALPTTLPTPLFIRLTTDNASFELLLLVVVDLLPIILSIAIVASLRSLLVGVASEHLTNQRYNSSKELIGQGFSNVVSAFFCGITSAGSWSSTITNFQHGGRSRFSGLVSGLCTVVLLFSLAPLVAGLPKVVLAGILAMIALSSFDRWSWELLLNSWGQRHVIGRYWLINLAIVVLVVCTMLIFDIFYAIAIGVMVSLFLFVVRMGNKVVRRTYSIDHVRANVQRPQKEITILQQYGHCAYVFELEGWLFFGTADKVALLIDNLVKGQVEYIILDLKGITEIDVTGARIIKQIIDRCNRLKKWCIIGSPSTEIDSHLCLESNISKNEGNELSFAATTEDAIAWAEERILDKYLQVDRYKNEIALPDVDVLSELTVAEIAILKAKMTRSVYANGDYVFRQDDTDDDLFFIVKGRAMVVINLPGNSIKRISTLCPGTVFGEMAILDYKSRSASVIADGNLVCYRMSRVILRQIGDDHPSIGYKILTGIGKELSMRLRVVIDMLSQVQIS